MPEPTGGPGRTRPSADAIARAGLGLLAPALAVFAARAASVLAGSDLAAWPGYAWLAAAGGILSALGFIALIVGMWPTRHRWPVVVAAVVAFAGHYVVGRLVGGGLGPAMVYLGTGFAASVRVRPAAYAGLAAGAGAIVRQDAPGLGHGLVAVGAGALALLLAWGAAGKADKLAA